MTKALGDYDIELVIADSPWFKSIPKSGLDTLIHASLMKHLTKGQYLYQMGETTSSCYCLLS